MIDNTSDSDVIIRTATYRDLDNIYRIEVESFKIPYPRKYLAVLLALSGDLFIVAENNSKVIGYAVGVLRYGNVGHVISIAVSKEWRRKGVGTKLMLELERRFKERSMSTAMLEVRVSNKAAIKLYEKLGYKIADRIRRYYPDGEDAYLMLKRL